MKNTYIKNLFMALIGCFSIIMSIENPTLAYVIIASIAFILQYIVKNNWIKFKSNSELFGLNLLDIINGLIIAIAMTLSIIAADLLTGAEFDIIITLKAVFYSIGGYLSKTFISNSNSELLTLDRKE